MRLTIFLRYPVPPARLILILLIGLTGLYGCSGQGLDSGPEAVFDNARYRIQLENQQLTIFDHQRQQTLLRTAVSTLLSAHQSTLDLPTNSHQTPTAHIQHSCQQAIVDKAEPTPGFLLLAGHFRSSDCNLRFSLRFTEAEGQLLLTATTTDSTFNHLSLKLTVPLEETIFGFGAQASQLNFKGQLVPVWIRPQGIGRGAQPISTLLESISPNSTGTPASSEFTLPYFLSSAGYGLSLDNADFSQFDFRRPNLTRIDVYGDSIHARLNSCSTLLSCISDNTRNSGRQPALPLWTQQGAIVGLQGGMALLQQHYQQLKAYGVPIAGILVEDWSGQYPAANGLRRPLWNWQVDQQLYPGWKTFHDQLTKDGVRLLGYLNPYLEDSPVEENGSDYPNLYRQALAKGFLVKRADGTPYPVAANSPINNGMIDLSNADAYRWLKDVLKQQVKKLGWSGWMADGGERLPADAVLAGDVSATDYHNLYAAAWARLNRDLVSELKQDGETLFFVRAGFHNSANLTPLFWASEQMTSWDANDGLQSAVIGLLNSGLSGLAVSHTDIGGYHSFQRPNSSLASWLLPAEYTRPAVEHQNQQPRFVLSRSPELLRRWTEMSAFTPLFRSREGLTAAVNAQVYDSDDLAQHFAHNARLFQALSPYRQQLQQEAHDLGWPMVRHPLLHYPDYPAFQNMSPSNLQFMLGDSLMVAPVLTPSKTSKQRQVFLPQGNWMELQSGRIIQVGSSGQALYLSAPEGQAPAYLLLNKRATEVILPSLQQAGLMGQESSLSAAH